MVVTCGVFFGATAQTPTVIPLASEPHHHLALHNEYVNMYQVEVAPHDSVLLHRHDVDAISVMMSDSDVTVHAPGRQMSIRSSATVKSGCRRAGTCIRLRSMATRDTAT
jgi:hypothetical protein